MVPPALDAYLDVVTGELVAGCAQLGQLARGADRPAVRRLQLVAVDVRHEPERRRRAHGALVVELGTDALRGTEQLGMGVAYVESRQRTTPEVAQHRPSCKG